MFTNKVPESTSLQWCFHQSHMVAETQSPKELIDAKFERVFQIFDKMKASSERFQQELAHLIEKIAAREKNSSREVDQISDQRTEFVDATLESPKPVTDDIMMVPLEPLTKTTLETMPTSTDKEYKHTINHDPQPYIKHLVCDRVLISKAIQKHENVSGLSVVQHGGTSQLISQVLEGENITELAMDPWRIDAVEIKDQNHALFKMQQGASLPLPPKPPDPCGVYNQIISPIKMQQGIILNHSSLTIRALQCHINLGNYSFLQFWFNENIGATMRTHVYKVYDKIPRWVAHMLVATADIFLLEPVMVPPPPKPPDLNYFYTWVIPLISISMQQGATIGIQAYSINAKMVRMTSCYKWYFCVYVVMPNSSKDTNKLMPQFGTMLLPLRNVWEAELLHNFTGEYVEYRHCKSEGSNLCDTLRVNTDTGISDGQSRFSINGKPMFHFVGTSTFSDYTVIHINHATPLHKFSVLYCGFGTGLGATFNVAKPKHGLSIAVLELGVVGLVVAEGARLSGASRIIGVIVEMTNGGVDRALKCSGNMEATIVAIESVHDGWGVAVIVGRTKNDDVFKTLSMNFLFERAIKGTCYGNYKPLTDFPTMVEKDLNKELELEKFIIHSVPFSEINKSFEMYGLSTFSLGATVLVGVVDLGGLCHMAVKFAKALSAKVTVINTSPNKKKEAIDHVGADSFVVSREEDKMRALIDTLDNIIDTVSAVHHLMPLINLLEYHGKLIMAGKCQWDPGGHVYTLCVATSSCFKLWDPGGLSLGCCKLGTISLYHDLEDKVIFNGGGNVMKLKRGKMRKLCKQVSGGFEEKRVVKKAKC